MQEALDNRLLRVYNDLNLPDCLTEPSTPDELAAKLKFVKSADITLEAMLDRLSTRFDFVERSDVNGAKAYVQVRDIELDSDILDEKFRALEAAAPKYASSLEFIDFGCQKFAYALRDDPDFMDKILSGRETEHQELWFRATNVDPIQNIHGIMGAQAIDLIFGRGVVLEIGGGTGNGIRNLFQHFSANGCLDRVERYIFTDISSKFIMKTRREILADYPGVSTDWWFVDLNRPLEEQKIKADSVDLIYAVNAAHVAKDIVSFLESCRRALRQGGRVVFAERIRLTSTDMAPRELALNLSVYHRTAAIRNTDYRPVHCYLSPKNWLKALELAGFSDPEVWPDIEQLNGVFPNQYAAVVTGVAA